MTGKYAAGQGSGDGDEAEKSFVSLNWVLSEELFDVETQLEWGFLDYLLLGTSASPLRKVRSRACMACCIAKQCSGEPAVLTEPVFAVIQGAAGLILSSCSHPASAGWEGTG